MRRHRGRVGLIAVALVGVLVSGASADIVTDRTASILVFPKVIANGTRDTLIQITNTGNTVVYAHCFYVNAALASRDLPPGPDNPPLWQEIDFDIALTRQQPTYWRVSTGRTDVGAPDDPCDFVEGNYDCPNSGIDPGAVPAVVDDFVGELKCIETDQTGAPHSGNHLKGEATIVTYDVCNPMTDTCTIGGEACSVETCSEDFDVAKYNAVGIGGNEFNNGDATLCLGGPSEDCPDPEYNGCPEFWFLNHFVSGTEDPVLGEGASIDTSVTFIPCTQNFESQIPETITLQLLTWDEFESPLSSSTQVTCWADLLLEEINPALASIQSTYAMTRIRTSTGTRSGVMMVATEAHDAERTGTASFNVHHEGTRTGSDVITIPGEQLEFPF